MGSNNEIYNNAIIEAKKLMFNQTIKNGAPSWLLTMLAVNVGKELAREYNVDETIVVLTLYLQHLVFDPVTKEKREFYEQESIKSNWGYRELGRQINTKLYDRYLISPDKDKIIEESKKGGK